MKILKRKHLLLTSVILLAVIITLGVMSWYTLDKTAPNSDVTFSPVTSFQANFYEYLSQSLEEIYNQTDKSKEVSETKINDLVGEGIRMIDEFTAENSDSLSADDLTHLNQLRFYIYSSIAIDEELTRKNLEKLPTDEKKLPFLYAYVESFALPATRPNTSDETFFSYVDAQESWAKEFEPNYNNRVSSLTFKAAPIGKTIPNFFKTVNDINNQPLDLDLFKEKYVLLDFWATWCLPCIAELPYLVEAYHRFNSKGFEIISVSLDEDERAFQEFIKERNISWKQYYDGKGFKGELVQNYIISGIPTLYLVNPQGKVIAADLNGEELIQQLEKALN